MLGGLGHAGLGLVQEVALSDIDPGFVSLKTTGGTEGVMKIPKVKMRVIECLWPLAALSNDHRYLLEHRHRDMRQSSIATYPRLCLKSASLDTACPYALPNTTIPAPTLHE